MNLVPNTVTSFFNTVADSVESVGSLVPGSWGLFANDSPDDGLGVLVSGLAGMAAALGVALLLTVYFRRYRSGRDMIRHGLTATAVLGLLAFAVYDLRPAALDYLGIGASKPQAALEIQPPKAAASRLADTRIAGAI
jgi:Na+/proline symporter